MDLALDADAGARLKTYFDEIGAVLGHPARRASFATYAQGLLADGERKSVEPIAARASADPDKVDAVHQRLLHFLNDSPWSDRDVRRAAAAHAIAALTEREPISAWLIDDTGFLKQGSHSVGVQRQYTGSAGKITNCQVGVSLSLATATEHVPIDFELYLPRKWTDRAELRVEARIPEEVAFRTKPELALTMIDRALADALPRGIVLADAGYGNSSDFRAQLRRRKLHYAVGIDSTTKVWQLNDEGKPCGDAVSVRDLALRFWARPNAYPSKPFRRVTWRDATNKTLSARFAIRRVVPAHDDGHQRTERERVWLVCEWPDDEVGPTKYYFAVLPRKTSYTHLIRTIKERWRTERVYQDLKGELGLDHFEGRRFPGWHHHVSVALCCYAFVIAERVRRFSPSAGRPSVDNALGLAA
jgi:SRSO17 transposase